MKTLQIHTDAEGVATIEIDLPNRSMNVLTFEFLEELEHAVDQLLCDEHVIGIVISSGKSAFCAGADLDSIDEFLGSRHDPAALFPKFYDLQKLFRKIETGGKTVAAAISGTALGGGFELCLACHYRVAADNDAAKFGLPEVLVGLMPGAGGTQRVPRMVGIADALPLLLQGKQLGVRKANEMGLIDSVVEPGSEVDAARNWVLDNREVKQPWDTKGFRLPGGAGLMNRKAVETQMVGTALLQKQTNRNYPAPIAIMSAAYEGSVLPIDKALAIESKYFVSLMADDVSRNMSRTLFINKTAAEKLVRRPEGIEQRTITKVGILGAGMMGAGIAYASAQVGIDVVLLDTSIELAEDGKNYSADALQRRVERKRMTPQKAAEIADRITPTDDVANLAGCDLIIEAVFEDRSIKADITSMAESTVEESAIIASNTSTLPISELASAVKDRQRFIGLHFFSPVEKMPLVEVILGKQTSEKTLAHSLDFVSQLRKVPIVVNDSRGFYTSRVFGTFTMEGMAMLGEGTSPALVENVARSAGMPVGPLAVIDEVSLDLIAGIVSKSKEELGDAHITSPGEETLFKMVDELDRHGRRAGGGFYDYVEDGEKRLWSDLADHFPQLSDQPTVELLIQRFLYIQAIESLRCLEEGVLQHPDDADVGSVFGWGFPAYTGGTISFIESTGVGRFVENATELERRFGSRFAPPELLLKIEKSGLNIREYQEQR